MQQYQFRCEIFFLLKIVEAVNISKWEKPFFKHTTATQLGTHWCKKCIERGDWFTSHYDISLQKEEWVSSSCPFFFLFALLMGSNWNSNNYINYVHFSSLECCKKVISCCSFSKENVFSSSQLLSKMCFDSYVVTNGLYTKKGVGVKWIGSNSR